MKGKILFSSIIGLVALAWFTMLGWQFFTGAPPDQVFSVRGMVAQLFIIGVFIGGMILILNAETKPGEFNWEFLFPLGIFGISCAMLGVLFTSDSTKDKLKSICSLYEFTNSVAPVPDGTIVTPVNTDPLRPEAPRVMIDAEGKVTLEIPPNSDGAVQEVSGITIRYTVQTLEEANSIVIPKNAVKWRRFVWYQTKEHESFAERF